MEAMEAVVLANLERLTNNLGKVLFLWATVVLLGGFVGDLPMYEFFYILFVVSLYGFRMLSLKDFGKKPQIVSRIQVLFITLCAIVATSLTFFYSGVTIVSFLCLISFISMVCWLFPRLNVFTLQGLEIPMAIFNLSSSIHWTITLVDAKYHKQREGLAFSGFILVVMVESSLFLGHRCYWQLIYLKYVLSKKEKNRPQFLLEAEYEFFIAVNEKALKEGARGGLKMNLIDYVGEKFLNSRNQQLRRSMLMLDAVLNVDQSDKKPNAKYILASKRGVVESLFQCMSKSFYLTYRRAAICLLGKLCKDADAFFSVAQVIQGNYSHLTLLVAALEPDVNKTVLEILKLLAQFQGTPDANPGIMAEFDFADEATHQRWINSLKNDVEEKMDDEKEMKNCRQKSARTLRRMLQGEECQKYLRDAASCPSQELQEIAQEIIAALNTNSCNSVVTSFDPEVHVVLDN